MSGWALSFLIIATPSQGTMTDTHKGTMPDCSKASLVVVDLYDPLPDHVLTSLLRKARDWCLHVGGVCVM